MWYCDLSLANCNEHSSKSQNIGSRLDELNRKRKRKGLLCFGSKTESRVATQREMKPKQSKEATERQMKPKHKHHLTLYENNNNCELRIVCHKFGQHLDESYNCTCGSPIVCYLCKEQLSKGSSCYICKQCSSKKSSVAQQSCFELPKEIQVACYRPHCLLHYERESGSESKELDCDFCNKIHRDYKYCCRECDW